MFCVKDILRATKNGRKDLKLRSQIQVFILNLYNCLNSRSSTQVHIFLYLKCFRYSLRAFKHLKVSGKIPKTCSTPNGDIGICIDIKFCIQYSEGWKSTENLSPFFLRASICEYNEGGNLKVCCGKYGEYRLNERKF